MIQIQKDKAIEIIDALCQSGEFERRLVRHLNEKNLTYDSPKGFNAVMDFLSEYEIQTILELA